MSKTTWRDSPGTECLALVLEAQFQGRVARRLPQSSDHDFVLLSYAEDFPTLWGLDNQTDSHLLKWSLDGNGARPHTVIVVCDGSPSFQEGLSVDPRRYVTPYDWAIAFSLAVFRYMSDCAASTSQRFSEKWPSLRILMLDLASDAYVEAFGYNTFATIGQTLPWIQIYRTLLGVRNEIESVLTADDASIPFFRTVVPSGSFGIETMFDDLANNGRILSLRQAQEDRDRRPVLDSLKGLWRNSLIQPVDRHHVGNLLGPMLLIDALPVNLKRIAVRKASFDSLRYSLRSLIELLDLGVFQATVRSPISDKGLLPDLQSNSDVFDRRANIRFLLVDDQYMAGYQHVLGYTLYGASYDPLGAVKVDQTWSFQSSSGELRCEETANCLLDGLEKHPPVDDWSLPRVLDLCDVLLLDLRLWSSDEARHNFLVRLIGICDSLGADKIRDAKFRLALEQARRITQATNLADQSVQKDYSEIEALALMPLLLSYFDPSLPIILFSSTHQRATLDAVSHRANIITDFAKPIFGGYGQDSNSDGLGHSLTTAITKAVKLHESRQLWNMIAKTDWRLTPVFELADTRTWNVMRVYNSSGSVFPERKDRRERLKGGSWKPTLRGNKLRMRLAEIYLNYFETGRHFDFTSTPWEILEGNLIPDSVLNDAEASDPKFSLDPKLSPNNYVAELVRYIRNKKTHGQARPPISDEETEQYRLASILSFMFFSDFLNNQTSPAANRPNVDEMASYLKMRYRHLRQLGNTFKPKALVDDMRVEWLDFVAYSACYLAEKAQSLDKRTRLLSAGTLDAVSKLGKALLAKHWVENKKTVPKGIKNGDVHKARIVARTAKCFYVEAQQPPFFGALPIPQACPHAKAGDLLNLVVTECTQDVVEMTEDQNALRLYLRLRQRKESPDTIARWFSPEPADVKVKVSANRLYYAYLEFSTHLDAHKALKQSARELRRMVDFAD